MSSFEKMIHPTLEWEPKILSATAHEVIRQVITVPESNRYASIVMSALLVHFATADSLPTWPDCTERHIAEFLRVAQLPAEFITIALGILLQFSRDNQLLYTEHDTAELLFIAAMGLVADKYVENPEMRKLYGLQSYQYVDRRWGADAWEICMFNFKAKLNVAWDAADWSTRVDLRAFMDEDRVQETFDLSDEREDLLKLKYGDRETWNRVVHFTQVLLNQFTYYRDPDDSKFYATAGSLIGPAAEISCSDGCVFDTRNTLHLPNDEPSGLPIHMAYRPWGTRYDPRTQAFIDVCSEGDFRHVLHGGLHRWVLAHNPRPWRPHNIVHARQITEGLYQKSTVCYIRNKRDAVVLNGEELALYEAEAASVWGRRVGFGKGYLKVKEFRRWKGLMGKVGKRVRDSVKALLVRA